MKAESKKFLKKLLATISPSGYEEEAARVWLAEAETISPHTKHDVHGNAHVVINKGGFPRVILTGHYDEIGFIISHIDDKGFIYIQPIGGWDPQISQGQRVTILGKSGKIQGVIGKAPVHWSREEGDKNITKIGQQWVDIGTTSKEETEKLVAIGDPLVLAQDFMELQGDRFACRGCDDKLGAFIVLEVGRILAERKIAPEVHIVATCQEEVGLRGSKTAAFGVDAHIGIATDVTFATDHPRVGDNLYKYGDIKIGSGAVVTRGPNIHPRLFEKIQEVAGLHKIKMQVDAEGGLTGTDARELQVCRSGMITGLISIPNRYMHSPCELCDYADVEACVSLIAETVAAITPDTNFDILKK